MFQVNYILLITAVRMIIMITVCVTEDSIGASFLHRIVKDQLLIV